MAVGDDRLRRSEALHERVRQWARSGTRDDALFAALAWDIARFQYEFVPAVRRSWALVGAPGASRGARPPLPGEPPPEVHALPALPVEVLRFRPVFAFEVAEAAHQFETSGTTSHETGRHYLRSSATYETAAWEHARRELLPGHARATVVGLLPHSGSGTRSSLEFMVQSFMDRWGTSPRSARWLWSREGIDLAGLHAAVHEAERLAQPILLCATSFALLELLELLDAQPLPLPAGSVVMPTGGFKGRRREVDPEWLRDTTFERLRPQAVVFEYGMTELGSQLYERTHPRRGRTEPRGLYFEPNTLRVIPVDPVTFAPLPDGQAGLASFIDLVNVDSAVRVLTHDLVVRQGGGLRLLGRSPKAPVRGCALLTEAWGSRAPKARVTNPPSPSPVTPTSAHLDGAARRVGRLLDAARVLKDPESDAGRQLVTTLAEQGLLSRAGIQLALRHCLESEPAESELERLLRSVVPAARVWVVLSANVFVAAHRAIALGLAASAVVKVKPSRREPHLARALHALAPGSFELVEELQLEPGDHVHVYGADTTIAALRHSAPAGVVWHTHGDGIGVAWLGDPGQERVAARGLAHDMVLFDQRGCASPRLVFVDEGVSVERFLEHLGQELGRWAREVPLGRSTPEEQALVSRFRAVAAAASDEAFEFGDSIVALQRDPERVLLPPPGRHLVVLVGSLGFAALAQAAPLVTTVALAGKEPWARAERVFPEARRCAPGEMQRPPFDGPLDRRQG